MKKKLLNLIFEKISKYNIISENQILLVETRNSFNIKNKLSSKCIVNLEKMNNIRLVNKFHESINNKLKLINELQEYFKTALVNPDRNITDNQLFQSKKELAMSLLGSVKDKWIYFLSNLDDPISELDNFIDDKAKDGSLFEAIQSHQIRISWKQELKNPLHEIFSGRDFELVFKNSLLGASFSTLLPSSS